MTPEASAFTGSVPEFYDRHLVPVIFEPYAVDLTARFRVLNSRAALELACGTGAVTHHLVAALAKDGRLTATDLNPPMLDLARKRIGDDPRVTWKVADATALPFADREFDALLCQFGWMFFPDKLAGAREARRVLKPGGTLIFNVWDGFENNTFGRLTHATLARLLPENPPLFYLTPFGWHDPKEIRSVLAAAGFADVTIDTVKHEAKSVSARDWAEGLVCGNPLVQSITDAGRDPAEFVAAVAKELAREGGEQPCRSSIQALVVTAR